MYINFGDRDQRAVSTPHHHVVPLVAVAATINGSYSVNKVLDYYNDRTINQNYFYGQSYVLLLQKPERSCLNWKFAT